MSNPDKNRSVRMARWYFGGLSASCAAVFTHPLDLMKVQLQTRQEKASLFGVAAQLVRENGILCLYCGISAALLRQLTYSMTRFGFYEFGKNHVDTNKFIGKIIVATLSGAVGGWIGTPLDMLNVRMQNDVKLPIESRRDYKNAIDGLIRVYQAEGFKNLFAGASTAVGRGALMTVGQIAFYDQIKMVLLELKLKDDIHTHLLSSSAAGIVATTLTQPLDVLKTRTMTAKPGEYTGLLDIVKLTAQEGPLGFFKGYTPALIRIGPHTILTFVFLEQLRLNFGYIPKEK